MEDSVVSLVLLCVAWLSLAVAIIPLLRLCAPSRAAKHLTPEENIARDVSVVIFADSDPEGLINVVNNIRRQRYKGNFQLILTVDPTSSALEQTVRQLQHFNPDLYVITVPPDTRNVSRRKLAMYLGVKAARFDEVVFVTSRTEILSDCWLQSVADCFNPRIAVVISPVTVRSMPGKGLFRLLRTNDFCLTTLTWIGAALRGHCYRGSAENMAYRKSAFFDNKGFARTLNYHFGDDDIFISEIARPHNVAVNLHRDGLAGIRGNVTQDWLPGHAAGLWEDLERRRRFTCRRLGIGARLCTSLLVVTAWLNLVCGVLGIVYAGADLLYVLLAAFSLPAFWITATLMLTKAFCFIDIRASRFTMIALLLRPLLTLTRIWKMRGEKDKNFTWQRLR